MNSNGVEARASGSVDLALAELVERLTARLQAGEDLDEEAVLAEHPVHAERLRGLLPALRLVAALSEPATEQPPGGHEEALTGTLGDFRLLREAGRGGMGVVYEAEQISLGRRVALKVLPFAATMDPRHLQRFHNEARAAACLHHEHIVPVHSVGSERGVHYYAMQFIDGRTLAAVIHDLRQQAGLAAPQPAAREAGVRTTPHVPGRASPTAETSAQAGLSTQPLGRGKEFYRSVARLGVQAALALEHAHQRGIVHRDIKPGNLLLDEHGSVWVTDFGLAQLQHGEGNLTMTGDLLGTLRYMSPEQTLAQRVVIDHRTDVYSLGVTLYELLTLRPAFAGSGRAELLRQVAFEEPPPPRKLERGIPAELETVVLKAMEKNPADRYATAQELADDLRRWLEDRPIRARRPTLRQVAAKWARRHQPAVAAAAVCLMVSLAALAGNVGWALGEQRARQGQAEARVLDALDNAAPGLLQGNPQDRALLLAVQQARAQLDAGAVGPHLRARVEQLLRDWDMLTRLETARLQAAAGSKDTGFDYAGADDLYGQAFKGYGVDVTALEPQQATERIRSSAIRTHLVAALDDWALTRTNLKRGTGASLTALADLTDDDPWRLRLRQAMRTWNRAALEELAQGGGVLRQPPANLVLLARALQDARSVEVAERPLRQAQAEHPADFWFNFDLANVLRMKKSPDLAEVVRFYQAALALRPQSPVAHHNLGGALKAKGQLDEAIAAYRQAIRLQPDLALPHSNLGNALRDKGQLDEAIAACRQAIRLQPDYAEAHNTFGAALAAKGQLDEAIAAFRQAIRLKPDTAEAHCNLGIALRKQGRFADALAALKRCHELGSRTPGWRYPSAQGVRQAEQMAQLAERLPAVLAGKGQPKDAIERLGFAKLCEMHQQRYAAAARFYAEAFTEQPTLAANLQVGHRYNAACAAALAGCGKGDRGHRLPGQERLRWRQQALSWLRADLDAWRGLLEKAPDQVRPVIVKQMRHWQADPDFAGVRGSQDLANLPEAERQPWQKLWADVAETLALATAKAVPQTRPGTK